MTGAAVGIGRAAAIKFAAEGANVVIVDVNYDKLCGVKAELEAFTKNVLVYECDITDEQKVYETVKAVEKSIRQGGYPCK